MSAIVEHPSTNVAVGYSYANSYMGMANSGEPAQASPLLRLGRSPASPLVISEWKESGDYDDPVR
jgi:hypothetical protein